MGFVKKLKTSGKWFAVNEICRDHQSTREIINGNATVIDTLSAMNAIMVEIASQNGVTQLPGDAGATLQGNGFPVPKIVWEGTLPYDTHVKTVGAGGDVRYVKTHEAAWRQLAATLRDTVYGIIESVRLAADILNAPKGEAPNPGGQVGV